MEKKFTVIPPNQTNVTKEEGKKGIRVAAYCRVSTDREEQQGSFANQIAYYTDYINEKEEYIFAGIFADEGISGTGTRKRAGFRNLIIACEEGKIDLVLTKSISRFARNTRDCLHYVRLLKELGVPVIFEKEGINTMDATGELLFTVLSSLAQEESRNTSENTRWGIRSKFQKGIPHINTVTFLGYDKDEAGQLVINPKQAKIVRRIFFDFLSGWQPSEIARRLNQEKIPGVYGEPRWASVSIVRMLQNEKYKGDILMQKYYIKDFLTKKLEKNNGKLIQYYVENNHEPIMEKDIWEATQLELKRREKFRKNHGIRELGSCTLEPFYGKIYCCCGGKYIKKTGKKVWHCINTQKEKGKICKKESLEERFLQKAVIECWNQIADNREKYLPLWEEKIRKGNPLEKLLAEKMKVFSAEGKIYDIPGDMIRMVVQEVQVKEEILQITFMDGTVLYRRISSSTV